MPWDEEQERWCVPWDEEWHQAAQRRCDAASQGPWEWWTSNSFRRLSGPDGRDGGILYAYNQRSDGHPDVACLPADREFIAHSREDLPAALQRIRELEAALKWCRRYGKEQSATAAVALTEAEVRRALRETE